MPLVPEYQAMLEALAAESGPPIPEMTPEEARALYRMMRPLNEDLAVGEVIERGVPGPAGEVPLRIYRPQSAGPHPVLLYLHGGGWVIGDLDTRRRRLPRSLRNGGLRGGVGGLPLSPRNIAFPPPWTTATPPWSGWPATGTNSAATEASR